MYLAFEEEQMKSQKSRKLSGFFLNVTGHVNFQVTTGFLKVPSVIREVGWPADSVFKVAVNLVKIMEMQQDKKQSRVSLYRELWIVKAAGY